MMMKLQSGNLEAGQNNLLGSCTCQHSQILAAPCWSKKSLRTAPSPTTSLIDLKVADTFIIAAIEIVYCRNASGDTGCPEFI